MAACASECEVVQDVDLGWEGFCIGLELLNTSTTAEACRQRCCGDPACEVWQWGNLRELASKTSLGRCYAGKGLECSSERLDSFVVLAGQQLNHGRVQEAVAISLDRWCTGSHMQKASFATFGKLDEVVGLCRDICYRDDTCAMWEYSRSMACWYGIATTCSPLGPNADMVAGERVTHRCAEVVSLPGHADYASVLSILGITGLALACAAAAALFLAPRDVATRRATEHSRDRGRQRMLSPQAGGEASPQPLPPPPPPPPKRRGKVDLPWPDAPISSRPR